VTDLVAGGAEKEGDHSYQAVRGGRRLSGSGTDDQTISEGEEHVSAVMHWECWMYHTGIGCGSEYRQQRLPSVLDHRSDRRPNPFIPPRLRPEFDQQRGPGGVAWVQPQIGNDLAKQRLKRLVALRLNGDL
jgi:hypothetical protein